MQKGFVLTKEFIVTSDLHAGFITVFNDNNPMHTDVEYAKKHGFEQKIMHGNILCGFLSYFVGECLPLKNVIILSQKINFRNPFFINDRLVLEVTVKDIYESVNLVELKFKFREKISKKLISNGNLEIKILV